jgi:hypothetical protein
MGRNRTDIAGDSDFPHDGDIACDSDVFRALVGTPSPSRPAERERNGRILVRITPALHELLAKAASQQGVSLNAYIAETLARRAGVVEARHEFERWLAKALGRPLAWRRLAGLGAPLGGPFPRGEKERKG